MQTSGACCFRGYFLGLFVCTGSIVIVHGMIDVKGELGLWKETREFRSVVIYLIKLKIGHDSLTVACLKGTVHPVNIFSLLSHSKPCFGYLPESEWSKHLIWESKLALFDFWESL